MSRYYVLLAFFTIIFALIHAEYTQGVCNLGFCDCTSATHPSWITVNCTVPPNQKLDIFEGDLPDTTTNLIVTGGDAVMIGANSLSHLKDIRQIRFAGTKIVLIRKFAALNLNIVSLFMDIENCDILRFEARTFSSIKGPLSAMIKKCDFVSIEGETFSWLLSLAIIDVRNLQLGPGSFMLDPTAANVGEHGPGMSIELRNVAGSEFPSQTFGSSAANIAMDEVTVHAIRPGAFSANTYNIVMATNCSFHVIEEEAFAQKSLIDNLYFYGCTIHQFATRALQSAISNLNISHTEIHNINTGAINTTVASVAILHSVFNNFQERGFELSSWNRLQIEGNSFDDLASNAIVGSGANIHELVFVDNELETIHRNSLGFIGQTDLHWAHKIIYRANYYGHPCHCNISEFLAEALNADAHAYIDQSYCMVEEFFARCFNVPEQNMLITKFINGVCTNKSIIKCEAFKIKGGGATTEIKNPRFPHKSKQEQGLSDRNKKVIGIVLVTCLGCILIALIFSFVRWMRRKGYCMNIKNFLMSSNSCDSFCSCICRKNVGIDNARSISQLSVNDYSERHRLNEPRVQEFFQESNLRNEIVPMDNKQTQTLPEELTQELLQNLKEKLDNPENCVEAREMIEHLYELTKMDESLSVKIPTLVSVEENIYDLPFQNTTPREGKNKKQMISVGTRTPSLDKLLPLSPYNRQTALAHEYFEPKDFAIHLYAEIANNDREKRTLLGAIPDVVAEQVFPRGPYLRAVREKKIYSPSTTPSAPSSLTSPHSPSSHSLSSSIESPFHVSLKSNSPGKMLNRPLPEKPVSVDPGEGTSFKHG